MDRISNDIFTNVLLPYVPTHALTSLLHTSKRFRRLALSIPRESQNHLEVLAEICKGGFVNLLTWLIGRGKSDLRWTLLDSDVKKLIVDGKKDSNFLISKKICLCSSFPSFSIFLRPVAAAQNSALTKCGNGSWPWIAGCCTSAWTHYCATDVSRMRC